MGQHACRYANSEQIALTSPIIFVLSHHGEPAMSSYFVSSKCFRFLLLLPRFDKPLNAIRAAASRPEITKAD
jgi:hypothetical protein